jgi:hypothetical protein
VLVEVSPVALVLEGSYASRVTIGDSACGGGQYSCSGLGYYAYDVTIGDSACNGPWVCDVCRYTTADTGATMEMSAKNTTLRTTL